MIHDSIVDAVGNTPVVRLERLFGGTGVEVLAKLDFLNPFGSTKDRVAKHVIEQALRHGLVRPGGQIVESSSGNFGIALASIAPRYGISVRCVVDPNICLPNLQIMRGLGAEVEMVSEPDGEGGYLGTRLRRVGEIVAENPEVWWVNQYANEMCWQTHAEGTAAELLDQIADPADLLLAAVSTTATLLGTTRGLRTRWPDLRVVAVDAHGSVVFGGHGSTRRLPGLGSSRPSQLMRRSEIDDLVHVRESDAIEGCRDLLRHEGILAGASSGALVAAARQLAPGLAPGTRLLTILPDRGERYLDLVFDSPSLESGSATAQARS
jgi:cysteine synthase A